MNGNILNVFENALRGDLSDYLFKNNNVKYISLWYNTSAAFSGKPEATGSITFKSDSLEGKKEFKGESIFDVLNQMYEFLKRLS